MSEHSAAPHIQLFFFESCPYCKQVFQWMAELKYQNPELEQVAVEAIDERLHPDYPAPGYYYYVPTFFVDGKKVHEGAATKEIVEKVLHMGLAGPQ